ncbi:GDP-mannose 4,6-dehydratase [Sulfurimonas sediminis]|uniref:GDP-mannose 4,6-dehydratase n=1 Tax=Sulfurimonas sediminis TaxID=2590020 RepID=UPI001D047E3F|nr:GDP-mannose 4,6-dehydratase [Sulfurimonas sediminis]
MIDSSTLVKSKKILVTGTAGFTGFHLAKKLLERGDEVVGIDNINDYYDVNLKHARLKELGMEGTDALSSADNAEAGNVEEKLCMIDIENIMELLNE